MFKTIISGIGAADRMASAIPRSVVGATEAAFDQAMSPPKSAAPVAPAPAPVPALAPSTSSMTWRQHLENAVKTEAPGDMRSGALSLGGAVAGAYFVKSHRVLGALGGLAAGAALNDLAKGDYEAAIRTVGVRSAGIAGSLILGGKGKGVLRSAGGFLLGTLAGEIVAHVMGSK